MSFSSVQTSLAKKLTHYVNTKFGTALSIEKLDLSYAGMVRLEDVLIKDSQKDTIIFVGTLETSILSFNRLLHNKTDLGKVNIKNVNVVMRKYKGNTTDELALFIKKFDSDNTTKTSTFLLTSDKVRLKNAKYSFIDLNKKNHPIVSYSKINGIVEDFKLEGPNIYGKVRALNFLDQNGMVVNEMRTDFTYTKSHMIYKDTYLKTPYSELQGDILMTYDKTGLSDFLNKVKIEADFPKASISLKDARYYYSELGTADILHFSTKMVGTLNDFTTKNLKLHSDQKSKIRGDIHFINSFDLPKGFEVIADITHLESDYNHLKILLPNILGKTLPSSFKRFGHFTMSGHSHITTQFIKATLNTHTDIGFFKSDLTIKEFKNIDKASYKGNVIVTDLPLGKLLNDPLIGNFAMDVEVAGKGFTLEHLDSQIRGNILRHEYKGYSYKNISINGNVKDKLFAGKMIANDPNLKLSFEGLADLSKEKYKFDFISHVERAEFNKLHLTKYDSISILKGDIKMSMTGNALENAIGTIHFKNASYTNQLQQYKFENFSISSEIKDSIQTIRFDSPDIVNGKIKGKFLFKDLSKLVQNATGSIYTNYKTHKVDDNQHLKFNFKIYNKIIAVFLPEVELGKNTAVRGLIDADKNKFIFTFKSPEILVKDNLFEKIKLQIDNKNPLFNTQLHMNKISTKYYDITDFDLVNITLNDSLHFHSEFNGGNKKQDNYNLDFYYTINQDNQSIVGFKKSDIYINNTDWVLNPNKDNSNKLLYDNVSGKISYDNFLLTSLGQGLSFYGEYQGDEYQDYSIDIDRVNLEEIIPKINNFDFKGLLNGGIWIEKRNNMLIPTVDVQLIDLVINNELQGDLIGEIKGTDSNRNYSINLSLEKEDKETITTDGLLRLGKKESSIDMNINFNDFQIDVLNTVAKGVMKNIRGGVSGEVKLSGLLNNPDFSGTLTTNNTGVYFPYTNIDYTVENGSKITLDKRSFNFNEVTIKDSYFSTKGLLTGSISHNFFKKWYLDLHVKTDNLLAINTPEEEEAMFYGTGYLSGIASITGSTDNVNIAINGSSNVGTEIIIPMSDIKTIETSKLIHYKSPEKEEGTVNYKKQLEDRFNGVTMDFNLNINKNATIEFIIDQNTGSLLRGNGTGNIQMDIDTKATFNMYGEYVVDKGSYIFKYGGIINKNFDVKRGGTISFSGNPYKAELDIEAVYKTKANPQVLLTDYEGLEHDIPVELYTKITGELFHSNQEFDIKIPNAPVSLSSELDFLLNQQDTGNKMIQFVSLLSLGSFMNPNDGLLTSSVSNAGSYLGNSSSVALSNALIGLFSSPDDPVNFGVEYTTSQGLINRKEQLEVSAATRVGKNKRIRINGEVYVPTGNESNSTITGNAAIEFPLNKKESVRAKVFQRKNPIQYDVETTGDYTRGFGILWEIDFNLLKSKIAKKDKKTDPKE